MWNWFHVKKLFKNFVKLISRKKIFVYIFFFSNLGWWLFWLWGRWRIWRWRGRRIRWWLLWWRFLQGRGEWFLAYDSFTKHQGFWNFLGSTIFALVIFFTLMDLFYHKIHNCDICGLHECGSLNALHLKMIHCKIHICNCYLLFYGLCNSVSLMIENTKNF